MRNAMEAGESPQNKAEKNIIMECTRELDVDVEAKMQEGAPNHRHGGRQ
jgi:hypothetical protein